MNYRVGLVVMLMAFSVQAEEHAAPDLNDVTCLKVNREVKKNIRRRVDVLLVELTLFKLTRHRLIEGFEARKYPLDQLATGLYELARDTAQVVRNCQRKPSRRFVDMLPVSVQALLALGSG